MYIYREEAQKLLSEYLPLIRGTLKDKFDFLSELVDHDDWSFVIKAHALIEVAVTQMLVQCLGDVRLSDFIERLPLSDGRTGKIVATKQLDLLSDSHRKFIHWFSELRNRL